MSEHKIYIDTNGDVHIVREDRNITLCGMDTNKLFIAGYISKETTVCSKCLSAARTRLDKLYEGIKEWATEFVPGTTVNPSSWNQFKCTEPELSIVFDMLVVEGFFDTITQYRRTSN